MNKYAPEEPMLHLFTNLGIVAGAILALGAVLKPLYMMVRRIDQVHNKVVNELPVWQDHVDRHIKELYPNSGSSIKDQVVNTGKDVRALKRLVQDHIADTGSHNVRQIRARIQLDTQPTDDE
jgi:hypothetical protein